MKKRTAFKRLLRDGGDGGWGAKDDFRENRIKERENDEEEGKRGSGHTAYAGDACDAQG